MRVRDLPPDARRLRPNRSLFWQAVAGVLAFLVPVSTALYFLTAPNGPWTIVLVCQVAVVAIFCAAYISYRQTGFWVSRSGIVERGFFGRWTTVPRETIDAIIFANTYRGSGSDTAPQLFVCDGNGKQLLRMRGQFWSESAMRSVSEMLDVPLTELGESVSTSELLDSHPELLYWFEKHPAIIAIAVTLGVVLVAVVFNLAIMLAQVQADWWRVR
jgi:hypothetical protein